MNDEAMLVRANRINLLADFYGKLLTERQLKYLRLHFAEDLSLAEMAEQDAVSRQAVNEHIRRACDLLEEYELKLQLLQKHRKRSELLHRLLNLDSGAEIAELVTELISIDEE